MTASFLNGVNCLMNGMNMMNIMKGVYKMETAGAFIAGVIVGALLVASWVGWCILCDEAGDDDIL